jgi:amidase
MTLVMTRRRFLESAACAGAAAAWPWPAWAAADEYAVLDATAQAELVRSGQVTSLELVDAAIARIEALNPEINAFVSTNYERAREQAQGELPDGPFRGVPYAIKDLSDYEGEPTTYGSRLFEKNVAEASNGIVQRALAAGLVILGKTNTPEFGLISTTESLLLGPARNPWNLEHHTGGSSGGAAAAVASGMLPCAQASDGGGSIRIPASVCGVFGLKPSRGRIFATRAGLPGDIAVRFAVSRSVRDSATLLAASERTGSDAAYRPVGVVSGPSRRRLRIAFSKTHLKRQTIDPEVDAALDQTAALCRELGHTVVQAAPPLDGEEFTNQFMTIWASQPSQLASNAWMIGLRQLRIVRAADVLEPWTLGLAKWAEGQQADALERAVAYMDRVTREFAAFFQDYDVLLTPVLADPPVKLGVQKPDVPFDTLFDRVIDYVGYTPQHNAAGTPAMSVPLSMSASGLPIGSQFAARVGAERTLLELAYELEAARPWAGRWAPHSAANL